MTRLASPAVVVALILALAPARLARAQVFPVLSGDPVDGLGRAHFILPGVPLVTGGDDGEFDPPDVDPGTIGDVDLVVRAGLLSPGATMPPPALVPQQARAGGTRFPGGTDIPFTVIASDGDPTVPGGHPLLGPELDGIPVVVLAWVDLDGDGVIGPTNGDAAGAADYGRELQETFPAGTRVAYFDGGVAHGAIAADTGGPASAGVTVVLTAAAYVGQFSPEFFLGTVPDGPAISTSQPFFPRTEPDRVIDTDGSAGLAEPEGRIAIEFEDEFEPDPVHPLLGAAFALPTDGSDQTIDRATVLGGGVSRLRFVRPSSAAGVTADDPRLPLKPDAAGALVAPQSELAIADDGPGNGAAVRVVPSDVLDNVADSTSPAAARLVASAGLSIVEPDTDGDPSSEPVAVVGAAGVQVTLDDAGGAGDSGASARLFVEMNGVTVASLAVAFGGEPGGTAPTIVFAGLRELPMSFSVDCPVEKTVVAVVSDPDGDASGVTAALALNGTNLPSVELQPTALPPPPGAPAGTVFEGPVTPGANASPGTLAASLVARDTGGRTSTPVALDVEVVTFAPPEVIDVTLDPAQVPAGARTQLTVRAAIADDCGIRRVAASVDRGTGFKRFRRLNDRGKKGDATARDGIFSGRRRLRVPTGSAPVSLRVQARSRSGQTASTVVSVPIGP